MQASFLYCEVCDIRASSEEQLRSHLLGQRHWYNKRQLEVAQRSVHVSGFQGSSVDEEELGQLFQQFGQIHKVIPVFDKGPKPFAIVEFCAVDSALQALRCTEELVFHECPLKVKPRKPKFRSGRKKGSESSEPSDHLEPHKKSPREKPSVAMEGVSPILWEKMLDQAQLKVQPDDIRKLHEAVSIEDQIQLLTELYRLPLEALQHRLQLISHLEARFQSVFPSCRVLPFGSFVTGLSTPTSDLDLVLLTEFSEEDEQYFGSDYLPLLPDTSSKELQLPAATDNTDSQGAHNAATTTEDMDTSCESSSSSSSVLSTPPYSASGGKTGRHCSPEFHKVLSVVNSIPECVKVLGLPYARCPIIRFLHLSTGVHCDLSIDNRLGPHNTRLLKAYLRFDHRVVPLLLVLRLWVRACGVMGISRTQLNNYALSLMLISALQSTSPPVLPSLQVPVAWPRNMEWYSSKGFTVCSEDVNPLMVDGWNVGFCNPSALLPSKNTASQTELLQHFFQFYAEFQFKVHAVTIHTPLGTLTTIQETSDLASRIASRSPEVPAKMKTFKTGPMCVQDPMELTHNVTKSLSQKTFAVLVHEMKRASETMAKLASPVVEGSPKPSLLEVLAPTRGEQHLVVKSPKLERTLYFYPNQLQNLFKKVEELVPLAEVVSRLDYSSQDVLRKLCLLVLKALVCILQKELGFDCHPLSSSLLVPIAEEAIDGVKGSTEPTLVAQAAGDSAARKRLRESPAPIGGADEALQEEDEEDGEVSEGTKRRKLSTSHSETSPEIILDKFLVTGEGLPLSPAFHCSAFANTWVHRRKIRRQQQHQSTPQSKDGDSMTDLAESLPPVLSFAMSTVPAPPAPADNQSSSRKISIKIKLAVDQTGFAREFDMFFAFFKKLVLSAN